MSDLVSYDYVIILIYKFINKNIGQINIPIGTNIQTLALYDVDKYLCDSKLYIPQIIYNLLWINLECRDDRGKLSLIYTDFLNYPNYMHFLNYMHFSNYVQFPDYTYFPQHFL